MSGRESASDDFDAFWERSLAEMQQIDPRVELIPAGFQTGFAECFDLFFTGVGDARLHAKLLRPRRAANPHPAVLMFHGCSGNAGDWSDKLGYVDVQHLCPRIRGEVLMGVGLMDQICPPSTQFAAYNKIQAEKSMVIYPDYGHETIPGHADKVFAFMAGL